jgi:hypothetical protein
VPGEHTFLSTIVNICAGIVQIWADRQHRKTQMLTIGILSILPKDEPEVSKANGHREFTEQGYVGENIEAMNMNPLPDDNLGVVESWNIEDSEYYDYAHDDALLEGLYDDERFADYDDYEGDLFEGLYDDERFADYDDIGDDVFENIDAFWDRDTDLSLLPLRKSNRERKRNNPFKGAKDGRMQARQPTKSWKHAGRANFDLFRRPGKTSYMNNAPRGPKRLNQRGRGHLNFTRDMYITA